MGLNDRALWEVQWHPAGGGRVRRLVLTWRGLRRVIVLLAVAAVLVLLYLAALPLGLRTFLTSFTVDAAQRENRALAARHDALCERAAALAVRVREQVQRGRRLAWAAGAPADAWQPRVPPNPAATAGAEAVMAWLARQSPRLEPLGEALAGAMRDGGRCPWPAMPTAAPVERALAVPVGLFGWRVSPFTDKTAAHFGETLAAAEGTPVLAPGAGRVLFAGAPREHRSNDWARLGSLVVLDHGGGVMTVFGHLGDVLVRRGQAVARGDRIATIGQTGWTKVPALYYELRWPVDGVSRPIDPGLVTLALPVEDLDARLADPAAGLPAEYPQLDHLLAGGVAHGVLQRPVRNNPRHRRRATPRPTAHARPPG